MSSTLNRIGTTIIRSTYRARPRRQVCPSIPPICAFHTSFIKRSEASEKEQTAAPLPFPACLEAEDLAEYQSLSPPEQKEYEDTYQKLKEHLSSPRVESEIQAEISNAVYELHQEVPPPVIHSERIKPGLMAMGEAEEQDSGEDDDYQGDDISSLAQGELEQHREIREYARIAAWEMPLLTSNPLSPQKPMYYEVSLTNFLLLNRTCQTLCSTFSRLPAPLPLHHLHGRNPPSL